MGSKRWLWPAVLALVIAAVVAVWALSRDDSGEPVPVATGSEAATTVVTTVVPASSTLPVATTVTTSAAPVEMVVEVRIARPGDDVEEFADGTLYVDSSDLEMTAATSQQLVGLRFPGVQVPAGAEVTEAWVQFTVDEPNRRDTSLVIRAEASGDAAPFVGDGALSQRTSGDTSVQWEPVPWDEVGAAGLDQRTPDLSGIVQQVVDRPDWVPGNAVALVVSGEGKRVATAYDGSPETAPLLHIAFLASSDSVGAHTTATFPAATAAAGESVRFAAIGDYGTGNPRQQEVADLISDWGADFIVTAGDNTYGDNSRDESIGQFYADYIGDYSGSYGPGAETNRFFPALGNHDYSDDGGLDSYLDYFTLPDNERYYEVRRGPVHLFFVNSNPEEPDGTTAGSAQGQWLQAALAASDAPWQIVVFHHAAYSSDAEHGSHASLQWPFAEWGADLVINGHSHDYERLEVEGLTYVVSGLGTSRYELGEVVPGSRFFYSEDDLGTLLVLACDQSVHLEYQTIERGVIDSHDIGDGECPAG